MFVQSSEDCMGCQRGLEALLTELRSLEGFRDWSGRMERGWQTWVVRRDGRHVEGSRERL